MSLIHPLSFECVKSTLDLFALPLTQGIWVEYGPVTVVKESDDTNEYKVAETLI